MGMTTTSSENTLLSRLKLYEQICCRWSSLKGSPIYLTIFGFCLCLQDKVTLKMFASTVEAGKLERAYDLVDRLNLEKSYELAMAIADSHRKLVDLIEDAKENKFSPDEQDFDAESPDYTDEARRPRISPDASASRKRTSDHAEARHVVRAKPTYD